MKNDKSSRAFARLSVLAACGFLTWVGEASTGCSADGSISPSPELPSEASIPPLEVDAGTFDAEPCDECAFFLPECAPHSFCPVTLDDLEVDTSAMLTDIHGTSPEDVWVAGTKSTLLHHDGTAWSRVQGPDAPLTQIVARSKADVWTASALTQFFVRSPGADIEWPKARLVPFAVDAQINGIWSTADATWTWLAVDNSPYDSVPRTLSIKRVRKSTTAYLYDEPFACGGVCPPFSRLALTDVHGSSRDNLWAVGDLGTTYRISAADTDLPLVEAYDSRTYTTLHGVWTSEPNDAWAVGSGGVIRHYTGSADRRFEVVASPVSNHLRAIAGVSNSDLWAVGDGGLILHYDGTEWSRVPLGGVRDKPDLRAVWAASATRVWAAGQGVLLELSSGGGRTGGGT